MKKCISPMVSTIHGLPSLSTIILDGFLGGLVLGSTHLLSTNVCITFPLKGTSSVLIIQAVPDAPIATSFAFPGCAAKTPL